MLKCQDIKHSLSARNDNAINVDDYDTFKDNEPPIKITREQFEEMSMDLINDIKILLKYATDGLQDKIEKVLHVGGSSRMPLIKSTLETMFPNAEQCCEKHPEEVVAVGAAYYSYHLAYNQ
uniref:Heat shock protein 70 n=1 Tax=Panagrolaimus superbus TaxID=310955 RepID=A0A914Y2S9_9BILA